MSLEDYTRAGQIASIVRENTRKKNHVGRTLFEICNSIEKEIESMGGHPAFPVNISLNEIAAHYTAEPNDQIVIKESDIVKIDLGVHINGFIADTAVTISCDPRYDQLIKTAEMSLSEATKIAKHSTKSSDLGKVIENTITNNGLKPIQNLSGHSLEQYIIHAGKSIPNIKTYGSSFSLSSNQAYAIEPFVTTKEGLGIVYEGKTKNIFSLISRKPAKNNDADEFIAFLWNKFKTLPFALRWLVNEFEEPKARELLDYLLKKKNIRAYPILVEGNNQVVSQAEHTIFITDNVSHIITK
jgi:methionyl aminopeptidase